MTRGEEGEEGKGPAGFFEKVEANRRAKEQEKRRGTAEEEAVLRSGREERRKEREGEKERHVVGDGKKEKGEEVANKKTEGGKEEEQEMKSGTVGDTQRTEPPSNSKEKSETIQTVVPKKGEPTPWTCYCGRRNEGRRETCRHCCCIRPATGKFVPHAVASR